MYRSGQRSVVEWVVKYRRKCNGFEFKKIGGKPKDKWKESLDKKYEKYKESAEYIKDKVTGKDTKVKKSFLKTGNQLSHYS